MPDDDDIDQVERRGSSRAVTLLLLGAVIVAFGSLWYYNAPPRGTGDYLHRSAQTAERLRSQAVTAHRWSRLVERDRSTREAATVGFEEAERAAHSSVSTQAAWPVADDVPPKLRSELLTTGNELSSVLEDVRIAAHEERWAEVHEHAAKLPDFATSLTALEERIEEHEQQVRR